jgi:tRNA uridine 5-carbamoylmethylation protein Kti12
LHEHQTSNFKKVLQKFADENSKEYKEALKLVTLYSINDIPDNFNKAYDAVKTLLEVERTTEKPLIEVKDQTLLEKASAITEGVEDLAKVLENFHATSNVDFSKSIFLLEQARIKYAEAFEDIKLHAYSQT